MADVAHLVRAPGCGSGGSGFNPHHSPHRNAPLHAVFFYGQKLAPLMLY